MFLVMQVTDTEILSVLRGRTLVSEGWGFVAFCCFFSEYIQPQKTLVLWRLHRVKYPICVWAE